MQKTLPVALLALVVGLWMVASAVNVFAAERCRASWYGGGEPLSDKTANGERFHAGGLTAAHRSLPMHTRVRVSYRGKSVVVRINDRGPAAHTGRCIDLARGAAERLGMLSAGVVPVSISIVR